MREERRGKWRGEKEPHCNGIATPLQLHSRDYNLYDLIAIAIVKAPKSYVIAMDLGNFRHCPCWKKFMIFWGSSLVPKVAKIQARWYCSALQVAPAFSLNKCWLVMSSKTWKGRLCMDEGSEEYRYLQYNQGSRCLLCNSIRSLLLPLDNEGLLVGSGGYVEHHVA